MTTTTVTRRRSRDTTDTTIHDPRPTTYLKVTYDKQPDRNTFAGSATRNLPGSRGRLGSRS